MLELVLVIACPHFDICVPPTEILEGGVKIIQNKYLGYASKINWLDIVKDGTADIMIEGNGPQSELGRWRRWSLKNKCH